MLGYYQQTLKELFSAVHLVSKDPVGQAELCLKIQETLVRKISYAENRIRKLKYEMGQTKMRLKARPGLDKATAAKTKFAIDRYHSRIHEYRNLISVFKSIGDALAFVYLDKWDIKPMAFKEGPGFISGKAGGRWEHRILRQVFKHGQVAILNDLTHCLRHADITLVTCGIPRLVEAKSGKNRNQRTTRQREAANKVQAYLLNDQVADLYQSRMEMRRIELEVPERDHRSEVNALIRDTYEGTRKLSQVEDGLFYFVETAASASTSDLKSELFDAVGGISSDMILFFINAYKHDNIAYYPYVLSFEDPQALFDFYSGNLFILVLVDRGVMTRRVASQNLTLRFLGNSEWADGDWMIEVKHADQDEEDAGYMCVSGHFFRRVACEFLSLDWFLEELIHRAQRTPEAFAELDVPPQ
jgi:hypothetical protein